MDNEIALLSAVELSNAYRTRNLSPVEVLETALARIEHTNPAVNAIYYLDHAPAKEAAKASEKRWSKDAPLGPLDGIPTTVKDALTTTGMPSYRGSAANGCEIAASDHSSVARLREGGAVILGKNTMCDYGILAAGVSSRHGVTRNPWDLSKTTGASSSGAAASVAALFEPFSVGTDIVGSIRLPASYCGLVGFKPSQGRVPYYFPNSPSLVAGPLARNVKDAALMMNTLSKPDERDFSALPYDNVDYLGGLEKTQLSGKKAKLILDLGFGVSVDEEVQSDVRGAARSLEHEGLAVDEVQDRPFEPSELDAAETFYKIRCLTELSTTPETAQPKSDIIWKWTRSGKEVSAVDLYRSFNALQLLREKTVRLLNGYDYLLLPSTPIPAHDADLPAPNPNKLFAPWCYNFLFNLSEQPALSINCGFTNSGLPIGLQIVGRRYDDLGVLQLAHIFEAVREVEMPWAELLK